MYVRQLLHQSGLTLAKIEAKIDNQQMVWPLASVVWLGVKCYITDISIYTTVHMFQNEAKMQKII